MICLAKVELWLHGYDIPLNGADDLKVPKKANSQADKFSTYNTLYQFWTDVGNKDIQELKMLSSQVDHRFFQALISLNNHANTISQTEIVDHVYQVLMTEETSTIQKIWDGIKSIGARIWDGIKRVGNWLLHWIKKGVKKVGAWIKNIARLAYHYAQKSFPRIAGIIDGVVETVKTLTHKTIPGTSLETALIRHDLGFNLTTIINADVNTSAVDITFRNFEVHVHIFQVGMQIMGLLIDVLTTVLKKAVFQASWLGLITALLKVEPKLKQLGLLGGEVVDMEKPKKEKI